MTIAVRVTQVAGGPRAQVSSLSAVDDRLRQAWIDLAVYASEPNPFAEEWFVQPAVAHLGTEPCDQMLAVWNGRALLGLLPLTVAQSYGRLPVRHVENWVHYHCFLGTPLVRAGSERAFWSTALEWLDAEPWACNFLHLVGMNPAGRVLTALQEVRRADVVHQSTRAMLQSDLGPKAYFERQVRPKKRKEIRRLRTRLEELGTLTTDRLEAATEVKRWSDDFLRLEASGWKGREGSALAARTETEIFFRTIIADAFAAGKLDMLRLALDGKAIAMLVNFTSPPGAYAFKIAFDESYARFSPGVLLKVDALRALDAPEIEWTDSCADEDHPMINSLWAERRTIVRVTVPLAGFRRRSMFHAVRTAEGLSARLHGRS